MKFLKFKKSTYIIVVIIAVVVTAIFPTRFSKSKPLDRKKIEAIRNELNSFYAKNKTLPMHLSELDFKKYNINPLRWVDKQRGISLDVEYFPSPKTENLGNWILVASPFIRREDPITKNILYSSISGDVGNRAVILDDFSFQYLDENEFQKEIIKQEGKNHSNQSIHMYQKNAAKSNESAKLSARFLSSDT